MSNDAQKLQTHLNLLREEYVKLQKRLLEVEKKFQVSQVAYKNGSNITNINDNFVNKLLKIVCDLYNKPTYSDITLKIHDQEFYGHRFVLAARSNNWGVKDLELTNALDFSDISKEVSIALIKWAYTDECEELQGSNDEFFLNLMKAAQKYSLGPLKERCETSLICCLTMKNCLKYYQASDDVDAVKLKEHASQLITVYWEDFKSEDFSDLSSSAAYQIFKSKTAYPLHMAIRMRREDVVFLYMMEFDAKLPSKLNEMDDRGDLTIDLALKDHLDGIASALFKHSVDSDRPDNEGYSLLHKAIKRGDAYSCKMLIENGCNINLSSNNLKETPLHLIASHLSDSADIMNSMKDVVSILVKNSANINALDIHNSTPLHRSIESNNRLIFDVLLEINNLELNVQDDQYRTPLWLALMQISNHPANYQEINGTISNIIENKQSMASRLVDKRCLLDIVNKTTGNTMLHEATILRNEEAGLFLVFHGADPNICNLMGETPLHLSTKNALSRLATSLLEANADCNIQTVLLEMNGLPFVESIYKQTPLHLAVRYGHVVIVKIILNIRDHLKSNESSTKSTFLDLSLKDSDGQTVLGVALWKNYYEIAALLLQAGSDVNSQNNEQLSLLQQAIMITNQEAAKFLLDNGADYKLKTALGVSILELVVRQKLPQIVEMLCKKGCNINLEDKQGDCLLWIALVMKQFDIANILVMHGCDTNHWAPGPNGCFQTLLHRAIDENSEDIACFLVKSKCDVNSPRKPGPNGEGDDEARDGQGPMHLSASWGLVKVLQSLIEENANVNAKDTEGDTPLHIGIKNQHHDVIFLLLSHPELDLTLRNRKNLTPFAAAMTTKNNKAAYAILDREPNAAEQLDNKGRNFLHTAIQLKDLEIVLFLLSVKVNVNSRLQDSTQYTPLHLAVLAGAEIIVRNLLLAGAKINDITARKQNSLHLCALTDQASIATILLENNINFEAQDDSLNNAFHVAMQNGSLNVIKVLLLQSNINVNTLNMRGQNPLHILGQYGKENAATIYDFLVTSVPQYNIDQLDVNGNSALLLAYFNGNSGLCKAIVKSGAKLGSANKDGISIFNAPVPTKQLLFKLLDMLTKEPPWSDGETCLQCDIKFGIKTRKHHCRHCGRLLCSKCSDKDMPILKYAISKPVRVCDICFDVLTLGILGTP